MAERISDAEHSVMEVLWNDAPLTANVIADRLTPTQSWSLATVKTLLSRLVAKEALTTQTEGRKFLYQPALQRSDYVTEESKRLVDRLFGGKLTPLFAHLAEQETLSAEDIAEIEVLLKALKP
jgi:BlaI family transcriptional regulator, penicillinase repressor